MAVSVVGEDVGIRPMDCLPFSVYDDGWVAEVRLLAASLEGKINPGKPWGFNIHRAIRDRKSPHSSWSYTSFNWHDPDRFGILDFD